MAVLVTGASGFIAQHIVKLLVEKDYDVIGTVRLDTKGAKLQANLDKIKPGKFEYTLVPDIAKDGAFEGILEKYPNITEVMHTASPFFYDTTDPEKDLIVPAVRGTNNILDAIQLQIKKGTCNVNRMVITSSDAALYSAEDEQKSDLSFNEESWNNISYEDAIKDPISAYYGAKSFAEKAAWKYAKAEGFPKLASVNPVYVFGPQAFDNEVSPKLNTSNELIHNLLKIGPKGSFDNDKGGFVDARDVAHAHVEAMERTDLVGKRLYMTNGKFSVQMMVDVIRAAFPDLKDKVPEGTPGSGPKDISTLAATSNDVTRELLKTKFILLNDCVIDVVKQIRANL